MRIAVLHETLLRLGACRESIEWAEGRNAHAAWNDCERGDWLLWVASRAGVDRRLVVQAACACARMAMVHVPEEEPRPLRAIETAEAWCRGEATIEDVRSAARSAYAAADAAAADDAAYAAAAYDAAAYAAAAYAAAAAAYAADDAAAAAYAADDAAAAAAARRASLARSADIVRQLICWKQVAIAAGLEIA